MISQPERATDFIPPPWLRGGHRMTLYAALRSRRFPLLPRAEKRYFDVAPDTRVQAECHWQPDRQAHPSIVLLHGLEGSANALYMCGTAEKAFRRGFNVVRLNQRNCDGTEHLTPGLYHSGLSEDPAAVINELIRRDGLRSIAMAGYSLGGNVALRLAGVYGEEAPSEFRAVCAVSPPIDLARAADEIERLGNRLYQWNFLRDLKGRIRRKAELFPDLYSTTGLDRIRTIRAFDERYTAPSNGFRDAADYYHRASALRVVDRIRVPTLVISAADDPFIPIAPFRHPEVTSNRAITVLIPKRGGHCGFVARRTRGAIDDGYWAERQIVEFAARHTP